MRTCHKYKVASLIVIVGEAQKYKFKKHKSNPKVKIAKFV